MTNPRLLELYGSIWSARDDVALVAYGPTLDPVRFEEDLRAAARSAGFDLEDGPKVIAILPPARSTDDEAELVRAASAILSDAPSPAAFSSLGRIGSDVPEALRPLQAPARLTVKAAPTVSVVLPHYGHATYLRESIESALAQTFSDFELLVIDDCSPDLTPDLIEWITTRDPRVVFQRNDYNLGLVGNHRLALACARGTYVKFLHADDRLRPHALERLVAAAVAHPEASLVSASRTVIDASGRPRSPVAWTAPMFARDTVYDGIDVGNYLLSTGLNKVGEPSTTLFRRDELEPEEFSSFAGRTYTSLLDISSWLSLLQRGRLAYIAEPLSDLRLHDGQYGVELGSVVQHIEWLSLLAAAHAKGYLAEEGQFSAAIATMAMRLVSAYVARPEGETSDISSAIGAALELILAEEKNLQLVTV